MCFGRLCKNVTDSFVHNSTSVGDNSTVTHDNTSRQMVSFFYEDYEYDYSDAMSYLPLGELLPVSLVYVSTLVVGLVGNLLVILVVTRLRSMRTATNIFLMSLASADLLLVLMCVPVKGVAFFSYTWRFGAVLCKLVNFVQNLSIICSVFNLTGLSIERYYAIIHPMKAKYTCTVSQARKTVICIWILSTLLASPTIAGQKHQAVLGRHRTAYWCVLDWGHATLHVVYGVYMLMVVLIIPFSLMTFAYVSICCRLWAMRYNKGDNSKNNGESEVTSGVSTESPHPPWLPRQQRTNDSTDLMIVRQKSDLCGRESRTRKQVVKMLILVVLLFLLCWGPVTIDNFLVAIGITNDLHLGSLKHVRQCLFVLSYINSCLNPVVYGFMSKNFRKSFVATVTTACRGHTTPSLHSSGRMRISFQTRSSAVSTGRNHARGQDQGFLGEKDMGAVGEA